MKVTSEKVFEKSNESTKKVLREKVSEKESERERRWPNFPSRLLLP
jgi:hypothetical protein